MYRLEVNALACQVQNAIDLNERDDLLYPELLPAQLRLLVK